MKNKMGIYVALIYLIVLVSCEEKETSYGFYVDRSAEIHVKNNNGADMLDPATPGSLTEKDFNLYYLVNGQEQLYFEANLDHPKGLFITKKQNADSYSLIIFVNDRPQNNESITYLEFVGKRKDTLKSHFLPTNSYNNPYGNLIVDSLWFNNQPVARNFEMVLN